MTPFSDNLIFFDTEFSSLNPYEGEILSIGLVKLNGEELYLEIEYEGAVSPWVKEHLLPSLTGPRVMREEARDRILAFAGAEQPFLISYVIAFDAPYLYKLLRVTDERSNKDLPYQWIILDFATMLFLLGKNPALLTLDEREAFCAERGIDLPQYREHHALDDARMLREVYLRSIR